MSDTVDIEVAFKVWLSTRAKLTLPDGAEVFGTIEAINFVSGLVYTPAPVDRLLELHRDLIAGAKRLIDNVELDVNGTHGKGGNGGLTSDQTIRSAGDLRIILSRLAAASEGTDNG